MALGIAHAILFQEHGVLSEAFVEDGGRNTLNPSFQHQVAGSSFPGTVMPYEVYNPVDACWNACDCQLFRRNVFHEVLAMTFELEVNLALLDVASGYA